MLGWALAFFAMALIGAAIGFGDITSVGVESGQIAFIGFVALFVAAAIVYVFRESRPSMRSDGT